MPSLRYALVAYVKNSIGEFVDNLRREIHPDLPLLAAHITLLPPRPLQGTESTALRVLAEICAQVEPFEVSLGEMESFIPTTPTVFIGVGNGASRLEELHNQLNTRELSFTEKWPYVPHLTIATMATESAAAHVLRISAERWRQYAGSRGILLDRLTFVREDALDQWVDLAPVPLGDSLVSR